MKKLILFFSFFALAMLSLAFLKYKAKPYLLKGMYYQAWTSDIMMQTLPIQELQNNFWSSLLYLHKKPPMLDTIRGILAKIYSGDSGKLLLEKVDKAMYSLWHILHAFYIALTALFLFHLRGYGLAIWGASFLLLDPTLILYATLLEGTHLSALLILWFFYELYVIKKGRHKSLLSLAFITVLLLFTRSVFQWYFLFVAACSLFLLKQPKQKIALYLLLVLLPVGTLLIKQRVLFQTWLTSTFSGYHATGSLWIRPTPEDLSEAESKLKFYYPKEAHKIKDAQNNFQQYKDNLVHTSIAKKYIKERPLRMLKGLARSFKLSLNQAVSNAAYEYDKGHAINALLPKIWKYLYRKSQSDGSFMLIFSGSILIWIWLTFTKNKGIQLKTLILNNLGGLALILPWFYCFFIIHLTANRHGWIESQRLQFLIGAPLYIFILVQYFDFFQKGLIPYLRKQFQKYKGAFQEGA